MTAVHEGHAERRRNRLVEVGVIEQDGGRLSAQFECDALHRRGAIAHDAFTHGDRAGEGDLGDVRIAHELGADDIAEAGHDVQETLRELGLVQSLDHHPCLQRAHLARLDDDGTTRGDGGSQLEANEQRVAFQAVIRPATPTGSRVTVVLPQLRVNGISGSAFSAAANALTPDSTISRANRTTPPYSSTIAAVRSSMRAEAA